MPAIDLIGSSLASYFPIGVAILAVLAVLSLALGAYRLLKPAGELEDRLQQNVGRDAALPSSTREGAGLSLLGILNTIKLDQKLAGQTAVELMRADLPLTVNEYVMLRFGGAGAGLALGLIFGNALLGLGLAVVGLQAPVFILHYRSSQKQKRFQNQLVDVITMLSSGLRAGVGLAQAMDLVCKEMPAPASDEFGRVVREMGLGVSLSEALRALNERMPGDDLAMLVTVINIQAEVGGNLAAVMENVVTTIRERIRIIQEIKSLTAMQRATSYILAGLPFLMGGAIMVINPDYMKPLFTLKLMWMPIAALVMVAAGFIVISRIVDIKV